MKNKYPPPHVKAVVGTVKVRNATLNNACTNTSCYWHTVHWNHLWENGCYMLEDINKCLEGDIGAGITVEEGLAAEQAERRGNK